ncbi:hypothetical protein [Marinobacter sp. MBR-105]
MVKEAAAPDGRRYTSIAIEVDNIDQARSIAEVNGALPWRYRAKPISIKMTPTPARASTNLLQDCLSNQTYSFILGRIHSLYGGRCQVCGADHRNRNGRRIAPRLMATWNYLPHANPAVKKGIRELIGLTAVCNDCLSLFSLSDAHPCSHLPREARKSEFHKGIARLAEHNGWTAQQVQSAITKNRGMRKRWDDVVWASDIGWLLEKRIVTADKLQLGLRAIHKDYRLWKGKVILEPDFKDARDVA